MRLFAAVQVPEVACTDLSDRLARVRDDLDDLPPLRWVDPVGWHLTLAFYGEVTSPQPLTAGLSRAAQHSPPGTAMLSDAGTFGGSRAASARSARLVWVGMVTEPQTLSRLAACCAAALPGPPVRRAVFRPHVTIARSRTTVDATALVAALRDYRGPSWGFGDLVLLRSVPTGSGRGPRYEPVQRFELGK